MEGNHDPSVLKWIPGGVYPARSRRATGMTALEGGILSAFGVIPLIKQKQKRPFGKEEPSVFKWIPGFATGMTTLMVIFPLPSGSFHTGMTALENGILSAFGVIPLIKQKQKKTLRKRRAFGFKMDPRLRYWDDNTDGDIPTTFGVIPYWDDSTGKWDSLCLRGHSINKTKTKKDPSEKKSLRF